MTFLSEDTGTHFKAKDLYKGKKINYVWSEVWTVKLG